MTCRGGFETRPCACRFVMNPSRPFDLPAFLRALFLILSAVVYTALLGPPALVGCFLDRSRRCASFFQGLWVHWLLRTNGIHLRLEGMENLKKDQSYILVSNHASLLDIPALISAAPFPVRVLAKKSLLWFPSEGGESVCCRLCKTVMA